MLKKRLFRLALLCAIGLMIGAGMGFLQLRGEKNAQVVQKDPRPAPMAGVQVGGPYTLVDQDGNTVTDKDFAGKYKLIYFGFTYCPAICPTELQKITGALKELGAEAENIQPLFITIDPERDTVPVMKDYVALFHPRLVGLTGSRAQIDAVMKGYRVFARKAQDPGMNDYTMDHSSFIYLMSPDDTLISMYRVEDNADYIVRDIKNRFGVQ
jgi:protein SCO1/2